MKAEYNLIYDMYLLLFNSYSNNVYKMGHHNFLFQYLYEIIRGIQRHFMYNKLIILTKKNMIVL